MSGEAADCAPKLPCFSTAQGRPGEYGCLSSGASPLLRDSTAQTLAAPWLFQYLHIETKSDSHVPQAASLQLSTSVPGTDMWEDTSRPLPVWPIYCSAFCCWPWLRNQDPAQYTGTKLPLHLVCRLSNDGKVCQGWRPNEFTVPRDHHRLPVCVTLPCHMQAPAPSPARRQGTDSLGLVQRKTQGAWQASGLSCLPCASCIAFRLVQ